jgi:hypothetical protein
VKAGLCAHAGLRLDELLPALCLSWDELRPLVAHSQSLTSCSQGTTWRFAKRQMFESKSILERRLGIPIRHFAYPGGNRSCAGARKFELAGRASYLTAVTTRSGHLNLRQLHALPRVSVNGLFQSRIPSFPAYLSWGWARGSNFFRREVMSMLHFCQPVTCYEPRDERIALPCLHMIEGADAFGQRRRHCRAANRPQELVPAGEKFHCLARPNGTRSSISTIRPGPSGIEKNHVGHPSICHGSRRSPARPNVGDIETVTTTSKRPSLGAMIDWPAVVLGIAGLCTVAWASFLIWLMTYLVRLAFA